MRLPHAHRHHRAEQGAIAIIVALSMTALMVVTALVVDFGLARSDKVANKGYADAAAAAGVRSLDGGDGTFKPFRGTCQALAYLKVNDPQLASMGGTWSYGNGSSVGGDPCVAGSALQNASCTANTTSTWASYHGTLGDTSVDIKSGYTTPDPAFDATGSGDNGVSVNGGCDQLAVIVQQSRTPGFGSLATNDDLVTKVRTVARITASSGGDASAALLMLERTDCPAISVNSNNTKIEVKGFAAAPGVIHADSNGSGLGCLPTNPAIFGKFANPGVSARQSESGTPRRPGLITTVAASGAAGAAAANATDGASKVCSESAAPIVPPTIPSTPPASCAVAAGRALVGRGPVDRRYNTSSTTGVQGAIATGSSQYNLTPAAAVLPANGYTVLPGACNNITGTSALVKVYVDCPGGASFKTFTFTNATTIVFNGDLKLSSTNTLSMPNVTRLYVKGSTAISGGLQSMGIMNFNTGGSATCASRASAASARIVVGTGPFTGGAQSGFHLCQTTVLMANQLTSASCPIPTPGVVGAGTAPYDNACAGYVDVNAGGEMDWTAPNHVGAGAVLNPDWYNLEDLALWTEASHVSSIGGGASMNITGVFFLPNANPFIISGHGNQTIAANAQFVARKLSVQGQGTLYMRPDPNDSFTLPLFSATFNLVR